MLPSPAGRKCCQKQVKCNISFGMLINFRDVNSSSSKHGGGFCKLRWRTFKESWCCMEKIWWLSLQVFKIFKKIQVHISAHEDCWAPVPGWLRLRRRRSRSSGRGGWRSSARPGRRPSRSSSLAEGTSGWETLRAINVNIILSGSLKIIPFPIYDEVKLLLMNIYKDYLCI